VDVTLPKLLAQNAKKFGDKKIAIREKEFGIWQEITWKDYYENVKALSLGLVSMGFDRGDKIAILGDNRPEWIYTELAAQAAGGISAGIYPDSLPEQVRYVIDHSDARLVTVEDQEQTDKILEVKDQLPKLKKVIVDDLKGLQHYQDPLLMSLKQVQELGRELEKKKPTLFEENLEKGSSEDVAIFCYTSGTTGSPKGAMLSHRNLISMAINLDTIDPACETDNFVSFLPLPWIGEQMMSVSWSLVKGFTVNFPESIDTVRENMREIGPHLIFAPPRIWEKMCSDYQVKIQDATWLKRMINQLCMPIGVKLAEMRLQKQKISLRWKVLDAFAYFLLFRTLRDRFGLTFARNVYTGGAALGPEIFKFFQAIGVKIKQIYGQTEIAGISVVHRNEDVKLETVGKPIPNTEIKISDTGEILSRSPSVFLGYYKNPEATEKTLAGGWLHSGDAGLIDEDGHLVVIDRVKDVMQLTDGTKFSPQLIENKLKFSPYISEAVILGKDRPYITALINMDLANTGKWAEDRHITYTTFADLSQKSEVYNLIAEEIKRVNKDLPKAARIQKFVMLYKELDADDEELTRTRKLRRSFIETRYKPLIETMYEDRSEVKVEAEIKYRDGREALLQTVIKVGVMSDE
jgi:long-chain acyl-CoA synthetase